MGIVRSFVTNLTWWPKRFITLSHDAPLILLAEFNRSLCQHFFPARLLVLVMSSAASVTQLTVVEATKFVKHLIVFVAVEAGGKKICWLDKLAYMVKLVIRQLISGLAL